MAKNNLGSIEINLRSIMKIIQGAGRLGLNYEGSREPRPPACRGSVLGTGLHCAPLIVYHRAVLCKVKIQGQDQMFLSVFVCHHIFSTFLTLVDMVICTCT